jgi:hypothetical protein
MKVLALAVPLLAATPAAATQYNIDITDDKALPQFLVTNSNPFGLAAITSINYATNGSILAAAGYTPEEAIGGYIAEWLQGYPDPREAQNIYNIIDAYAAAGIKRIWINEINPKPGESNIYTPASLAYNAAGVTLAYNYIHSKYPGVTLGLSYPATGDQFKQLLDAGMPLDFVQTENFYGSLSGPNEMVNPFANLKAAYPNVQVGVSIYGTMSPLCSSAGHNWMLQGSLDFIEYWNANGKYGYGGPNRDPIAVQNMQMLASGGVQNFITNVCLKSFSAPTHASWTWAVQTANFVVPTQDVFWAAWGQKPTSTLGTCEYLVQSGAGSIYGPSDPNLVITQPWTPRPCNGNVTVTVGAGQMCRDVGTATCQLWLRARDSNGVIGNPTYQLYSISY